MKYLLLLIKRGQSGKNRTEVEIQGMGNEDESGTGSHALPLWFCSGSFVCWFVCFASEAGNICLPALTSPSSNENVVE